ncbi:hypothetical protein [Pelistega sp. MC2]|uniref:aldose epimerase family protein n=1 Tax=Pelistega sp. MC2 TaxID=1720297 RepID=UPI0008DA06B7|nr:hypothetical protein [Pelistega sp. MC2]
MNQRNIISLAYANQELDIVPSLGAAIARYQVIHQGKAYDFLRRASKGAIDQGVISEMASFLMAPWAGRIQNGTFNYQGKDIHYPSSIPNFPHSMHGFTRDKAWHIVEQTAQMALLAFNHSENHDWPFSFELFQRVELTYTGVTISVTVQNIGDTDMPFSLGHHPFFPCNEHTLIKTNVQRAWYSDDELMPIVLNTHPACQKLAQGLYVQEQGFDTIFTDWDKKVEIYWLDERRYLRYYVTEPMGFFVLYNPPGEKWFCAEPFGNITNSFNLREKYPREIIGGMDIKAGEKIGTRFELVPGFELQAP